MTSTWGKANDAAPYYGVLNTVICHATFFANDRNYALSSFCALAVFLVTAFFFFFFVFSVGPRDLSPTLAPMGDVGLRDAIRVLRVRLFCVEIAITALASNATRLISTWHFIINTQYSFPLGSSGCLVGHVSLDGNNEKVEIYSYPVARFK